MSANVPPPVIGPTPSVLPAEFLPKTEHLMTEDGAPVDNIYSEKQMRLLTSPLYDSWKPENRRFLACADVGLFYAVNKPPIVPDVFLSMDVVVPGDWWTRHRSYFFWEFGKAPEVAIEVVSNLEGGEDATKLTAYARIGIAYYVIWDPLDLLKKGRLRVFSLHEKTLHPAADAWFPAVGLGLTLWHGTFEEWETDWLRWCDQQGRLILSGAEQRQRADRLAAQLRALGAEPQDGNNS